MRRLLVLLALAATSLHAQKSGSTAAAGATTDPFVGSFVNEDQETITIQKQGSTYSGAIGANGTSYQFTARKMGRSLVGTLTAQGQSVLVQFTIAGDVLNFTVNGQTTTLRRGSASARSRSREETRGDGRSLKKAPFVFCRLLSSQSALSRPVTGSSQWTGYR